MDAEIQAAAYRLNAKMREIRTADRRQQLRGDPSARLALRDRWKPLEEDRAIPVGEDVDEQEDRSIVNG